MQKYNLQPGTGFIKRRVNLAGQDPIYQQIWDECYNPKTGALFFAEHCCYTRNNGIVKYNPRDYQKEMLFLMNNHQSVISLIARQMGKCCSGDTMITVRDDTGVVTKMAITDLFRVAQKCGKQLLQSEESKTIGHPKKFIATYELNNYEALTDTGWESIKKMHQTVFYNVWKLKTETHQLSCADMHLVFNANMAPIYVDELVVGDAIWTDTGLENVVSLQKTDTQENMYDLELGNDSNHRYYTNGILSHNTVTSCCYILWYGMAFPEKDILITSFGEKSAVENMSKIKSMYEYCPDFLKIPIIKNNETSLIFSNGTRIYCRPTTPKAPRGLSPAIIYCDEFAFVGGTSSAQKSLENQQEFYAAISPALSATHGKLFITSTPISETDLFYRLWAGAINKTDDNNLDLPKDYALSKNGVLYDDQNLFHKKEDAEAFITELPENERSLYKPVSIEPEGNNGFASIFADWTKDPEKTEEWARRQRLQNGLEFFSREFECRFIGKSKTLVNSDKMRELIDGTRDATYKYVIDNDVRFYKELDPASKYLIALDPSMGVSGDFAAMQIFEFPSFEQVGEWMSDSLNQNGQVEKMRVVTDWIYEDLRAKGSMRPNIYWTFENNTVGEGFLCALREKAMEEGSPEKYIQHAQLITEYGNKRIGWTTDKRNKATACSQLKTRIENGSMVVHSKAYVQQLSNYTLKEVSYSATDGNHDDLISASLLVIMMYLQEMNSLDLLQPIETKKDGTPEEVLKEWLGDYFNSPFM